METLHAVKERPILFNGEMVRAVLDGRKTQTRRVMKPQPRENDYFDSPPQFGAITTAHPQEGKYGVFKMFNAREDLTLSELIPCPYGAPGDQLYVRETWGISHRGDSTPNGKPYDPHVLYRASDDEPEGYEKEYQWEPFVWRPSIHMPRKHCRIQLEITDVRVERVQDISEDDAKAEGISMAGAYATNRNSGQSPYISAFADLWDSIYKPQGLGWDVNPWVWVVEFKRIKP